ncbi:MAG: TetR/AcrR family transcriptional regulator [Muribaculaceae bacterium]|nr:TetR/AcrR family transcriptional regulator [Muribaculaceae bacterium]
MLDDKVSNKNTEELILKAAEQEFMTKGFDGARTTSIAEAAGVTHAMFHYYFRTKDRLFNRIITDKITILVNALMISVTDREQSLDRLIKNIIDRHLDFISSNPDLPHFVIREIYSNPDKVKVLLDKLVINAPVFFNILQDKIDRSVAAGICRHIDARMLMLDIASLNVLPYLASPIVNSVLNNCMANGKQFVEMRKRENFDTIMRKLKP